jgi:hypothetical protein
MAGALGTVNPALLAELRINWEVFNNRWNQWVLNYSRGTQFDLLKQLGVSSPSWQDLALMLILALSSLSLLGAGWAWWDRHRQDPWVRLMSAVRRRLVAAGLDAPPHLPARGLAVAVRERFRDASALAESLDEFDRERYGPGAGRRPSRGLASRLMAGAGAVRGGRLVD